MRKMLIPYRALCLAFILLPTPALAQQKEIPRDTSFAISNTAAKVIKQYPQAALVEPSIPPGVVSEENIVYEKYGEREMHLDLFMPREKRGSPFPGVILIHGGGWRSGNRQMEWPMALYLAERGYVTATVEYRLSVEALYPAGIYDLKSAIRWMRAHAAEYAVNPNAIAVYGCSAGGELAAFLGTTGDMKQFEGTGGNFDRSSRVQAVVDVDGILDFTNPAESAKDDNPKKPSAGKAWFGASYKENPAIWRDASPIRYINEQTAPMLFVNSSLERFHAGRDSGIAMMSKLGIATEVHTIPDTPHPFWLFHPWFDEAAGTIAAFLDKTLRKK